MTLRAFTLKQIVAGLFIAALLGFMYINSRPIDEVRHNRVITNLSKLDELDSQLNEDVIKLRYGLLNNYDPLVATLEQIRRHKRDLEQGDYAIVNRGNPEIDQAIAAFSRALTEKEALVDQFKSHNSLLRNSLYYLPLSVENVIHSPLAPQSLRQSVESLLRDVLLLRARIVGKDDYEYIIQKLKPLMEEQGKYPAPLRAALEKVIQHTQNIVVYRQAVDHLVLEITSAATDYLGSDLTGGYNRSFQRELNRANVYRFFLFLFSLGLLAYAAFSFLRLRKNAARLKETLEGQAHEITQRKKAELALRESEEQSRLAANALENTAEGVMIFDANRRIVSVNKAFTSITGYAPDEAIGRDPEFLRSSEHDDAFYAELWGVIHETGLWKGEMWRRRKNGEIYPEWRSITAVKGQEGKVSHYVAVFDDISQVKQDKARLEFMAHHDALTHLPNRTLFHDRLEEALHRARRHGTLVGVLFLDLDHFKNINDSLGHGVGDMLLQSVTTRLKTCVRDSDTVSRFGGDEFAILLDELREPQDAAKVAEKLRDALTKPFTLDGHELFISASIGISCFPEDGEDAQTLLKNADVAMYRAKEMGRNTYQFFSTEMNAHTLKTLLMTNNLRVALERNEFLLNYQPVIDLSSGRITGVEALIRWKHPELGMVPPLQFIPLAENTGLIGPIGEWVLRTACRQMRDWQASGIAPKRMAVNLSARQFRQKDLVQRIASILEETGLDPPSLELEITESMVMHDPAGAEQILDELHRMGVYLAIDDFGTGYSSLSYLKRFPIDFLKIDRSFVKNIPEDPEDVAITRAIIALARSLDLWVIAEGVETDKQLAFIKAEGCEEAQGYLFSKPRTAEELEPLLRESSHPTAKASRRI